MVVDGFVYKLDKLQLGPHITWGLSNTTSLKRIKCIFK